MQTPLSCRIGPDERTHARSLAAYRAAMIPISLRLLVSGLVGCRQDTAQPVARAPRNGTDPPAISWTHFDVPASPPVTAALLALGKTVYQNNCAACHGARGAGDGRCARFLLPIPRDFTAGVFRFKTTPDSALPTDQDLFRTVSGVAQHRHAALALSPV